MWLAQKNKVCGFVFKRAIIKPTPLSAGMVVSLRLFIFWPKTPKPPLYSKTKLKSLIFIWSYAGLLEFDTSQLYTRLHYPAFLYIKRRGLWARLRAHSRLT